MATIVTRATNGAALSWTQADANIVNLNNDKIELTDISASTSGDGSLSYNNTTGLLTYVGPGTSEYRAAFTAGTGISITDGVIANTQEPGGDLIDDTTPQLGGNLDVNDYKILNSNSSSLKLGSGLHDDVRNVGYYYSEPNIVQNTTNRTYAIRRDTNCAITTDINSTLRMRGEVSVSGVDLNGFNANSSSLSHFGGHYYFPGIKNSGATGGDVGVFAGMVVDPELHDNVSITDTFYGITTGGWFPTSGTINKYVGLNVNPPNANNKIVLQCSDADADIVIAGNVQSGLKNYRLPPYDLGDISGTITPDCANGNVQKATLTGNVTINGFANAVAGQSMTLILTQDATGGRTLTSTMKAPGGASGRTLSTAPNAIDILNIYYDGSTYFLTMTKGFA